MSEIDLTILRARALDGDAEAQFDLALCYADGEGVRSSPETAFRWLLKAAQTGHLEAMGAVGRCYHGGLGVAVDDREALHWYDRALEAGADDIHLDLGQLLADEASSVRDVGRAMLVLQEGWERHGDPDCAGVLSEVLEDQGGREEEALEWAQVAAEGGDPAAMVTLGFRHRFGEGLPRDFKAMLRWYRKAAELGDPTAIANLAICYQNGEGVKQDPARAYELRSQAAELGHRGSAIWLAFALVDGTGCEPDPEQGRARLEELAAEDPEVAHDLADRLIDGPGLPRDIPAGLHWMRDAADRGHGSALTYLGVLHWYGRHVELDRERAVELYTQAAELGDAYAMANLGFAALDGEAVHQDLERGRGLLAEASAKGNAHAAKWLATQLLEGTDEFPRDDQEAVRVLEACSAAEEDGDVLFLLAELVRDGRGTRCDRERALELFELASIQGRDTRVERAVLRRELR